MTYGNEQNINRLQEARDKNLAITKATMQARRDFENGAKPVDYPDIEPNQFAMQKAYDTERQFLLAKSRNKSEAIGRFGLNEEFEMYVG